MIKEVLIIIECSNGDIDDNVKSLIDSISDEFKDYKVNGVLFKNDDIEIDNLNKMNLDKLYVVNRTQDNKNNLINQLSTIEDIVKENNINLVIGDENETNRILLPKISAKFNGDVIYNCSSLSVKENSIILVKEGYYGNILSKYMVENINFISLGIKNISEYMVKNIRKCEVLKINETNIKAKNFIEVIESIKKSGKTKDICNSDIVVGVGRAFTCKEDLKMVFQFAEKIGAALGATRPLVDAGIIDLRYQIGQTGRTISPKLYIALGISGAPQHICGMIKSSKVIAVNKDKDAEIFNYSDVGFVADVFDILKSINEEIQ